MLFDRSHLGRFSQEWVSGVMESGMADGKTAEESAHSLINGRRVYSPVYKTAWICSGVILIAGCVASMPYIHGFAFIALGFLGGAWAGRSPYRAVVVPKWLDTAFGCVVAFFIVIVFCSPVSIHRLLFWIVVPLLLVVRIFVRREGEVDVAARDDVMSIECWQRVGRLIFGGLRFSVFLLFGVVAGAGLAAPIVLEHFKWMLGDELGGGAMAVVGVYLLAVAVVGTWASLGAFGCWAGQTGGRKLRFAVQVLGIVLAAIVTLPLAVLATGVLMVWKGGPAKDGQSDMHV